MARRPPITGAGAFVGSPYARRAGRAGTTGGDGIDGGGNGSGDGGGGGGGGSGDGDDANRLGGRVLFTAPEGCGYVVLLLVRGRGREIRLGEEETRGRAAVSGTRRRRFGQTR